MERMLELLALVLKEVLINSVVAALLQPMLPQFSISIDFSLT